VTISQQAYVLHARYSNQVIDGRTREEGSDLDLTWRGSAAWNPNPGHLIEFGANAQTLDAERHRPPILGSIGSDPARCHWGRPVGGWLGAVPMDACRPLLGHSRRSR
jgi:hypothetical protein